MNETLWGQVSLRDYFAAQALTGILSSGNRPACIRDAVEDAYEIAEAMVEASHRREVINDAI